MTFVHRTGKVWGRVSGEIESSLIQLWFCLTYPLSLLGRPPLTRLKIFVRFREARARRLTLCTLRHYLRQATETLLFESFKMHITEERDKKALRNVNPYDFIDCWLFKHASLCSNVSLIMIIMIYFLHLQNIQMTSLQFCCPRLVSDSEHLPLQVWVPVPGDAHHCSQAPNLITALSPVTTSSPGNHQSWHIRWWFLVKPESSPKSNLKS